MAIMDKLGDRGISAFLYRVMLMAGADLCAVSELPLNRSYFLFHFDIVSVVLALVCFTCTCHQCEALSYCACRH